MQKQLDFNFFKDKETNHFIYILKTIPILLAAYVCFFVIAFFISSKVNPQVLMLNTKLLQNIAPIEKSVDLSNTKLQELKLEQEILKQQLLNSKIQLEQLQVQQQLKKMKASNG